MLRYMELKKKKKKRRIEMWCVKKIIRSVYDKKNVNNFFGWILNISLEPPPLIPSPNKVFSKIA